MIVYYKPKPSLTTGSSSNILVICLNELKIFVRLHSWEGDGAGKDLKGVRRGMIFLNMIKNMIVYVYEILQE